MQNLFIGKGNLGDSPKLKNVADGRVLERTFQVGFKLDDVRVEAYGSQMPLAQVASLATPDSRTITVTPFDKSQLHAVEKAILVANLGLNPQSDGKMIDLDALVADLDLG